VFNKAGYVFDAQIGVELIEFFIYKLSAIVGDDGIWDAISVYDILKNELLYLLGCNGGKRFGFYPLGEVVDGYYQEFYLASVGGEGAEDVHFPLCEGPWG